MDALMYFMNSDALVSLVNRNLGGSNYDPYRAEPGETTTGGFYIITRSLRSDRITAFGHFDHNDHDYIIHAVNDAFNDPLVQEAAIVLLFFNDVERPIIHVVGKDKIIPY